LDPWASIAAATSRRSIAERLVGPDEAVTAGEALDGYLGAPTDPGGPARRVTVGGPADLVLLDRPLAAALADPASVTVRGTWISGRRVWGSS
ncbi:MAG: amidohydrolase family protein, partial [Streptomyces sp.]|uniref:amidohydrolase family protein n=1 Tax=Streptomyces sp. TaxID=1931 RepID=UPI0025E31D51